MEHIRREKWEIKIDGLVEHLNNEYTIKQKKVLKEYNNICNLIKKYEDISKNKYLEFIQDGRQYYGRAFSFDRDFKYYYKMHWDIERTKEVISNNKLQVYEILINKNLIEQIDVGALEMSRVKNPSKESVILADYDPMNMTVIIDGNHRIYSAYLRGEKTIKAFVLKPQEHMQSMVDDLLIEVFKIHHNLVVIHNFINNGIDKIYYGESGAVNCLYGLPNGAEILKGIFRRIIKKLPFL